LCRYRPQSYWNIYIKIQYGIKVKRYRTRKSTRYYPLNTTAQEARIMVYVLHTTIRKILLFLLDYDRCTSNDIMQYTKKRGSSISWHLSWLRKAGIISARSGMHQSYRLRNKDLVAILMNKSQKRAISYLVPSSMLCYQMS
jgi:predicted transcriptional regulator